MTEQPEVLGRFCCKCRVEIPSKRVSRGSFYCSAQCRQLDRTARRRWKAERFCRLCGRRIEKRDT